MPLNPPPPTTPVSYGWRLALETRRRAAKTGVYRPLVPMAIAVAAGIAADRVATLGALWWLVAVAGVAAWAADWRRKKLMDSAAWLLLAVAATGAAWHHANWRLFDRGELGRFAQPAGGPICLEATVTDAPRIRAAPAPSPLRAIPQGEKTEVWLRVDRVRHLGQWLSASGRAELIVDGHRLGLHAGDRVRVFAQVRSTGGALNPGQFDFAADSRSDRVLATLRCDSPDCVLRLSEGNRLNPWRLLSDSRSWIEDRLHRRLGRRRGPVAAAMLIGARQSVPRATTEAFRRTGNLHVLVVSGLHVGLVVAAFYAAARIGWFPRRPTLVVVMLLILAYTLLTGARPPAVRAAVLAEVMCLAALVGANTLAINSLAAAAIIVLALSPAELFRAGPQLSFIAAATLICLGRRELDRPAPSPIERLLASVRPWRERCFRWTANAAWLILLATLVVWVTTAPLLATRFHLLSPIAVPFSLGVFPLVGVAVVSGLAVVAAELVAPPLASLPELCCGWSVEGLMQMVEAAEKTPGGSFWLAGPAGWWTVGAYALMAIGLVAGHLPKMPSRLTKLGAGWITFGVLAALANQAFLQPTSGLRCSFIAVGHGCSVLVEAPTGETLLYDAGSLGSPELAAETIAGVLWSRGITKLDLLVLSHADVDHFNAAPGLIERLPVGRVVTTPAMFGGLAKENPRSAPAFLRRAVEAAGVPIELLRQGDQLKFGGATAQVMHPLDGDIGDSDNATSLVLAIELAGRRVLLPGDLEGAGMEDLLVQAPWDCDVLLAPHHGSARSDPPGFAAWSRPEIVVVSGGVGEAYSAEAGRTYSAGGAQVVRTAEVGMVEITLASGQTRVWTFVPAGRQPANLAALPQSPP